MSEKQSVMVNLGQYRFDVESGELRTQEGELRPLRAQSAEVLSVLARKPNELVTKDELFGAVWPGVTVTEDSLTQCISDIRKMIEDTDRTILRTIPKKGYQLVAAPTKPTAGQSEQGNQRVIGRRLGLLPGAVFAVAFCALAIVGYQFLQRGANPGPQGSDRQLASIIVLPFADLSPDGDFQYFADGMSEDITTELARWAELKVIARTSALTYKGKTLDVRQVAREMGVRYVLECSVRRAGPDAVRINAQLIDGDTGAHVWADRFDETGSDVLALQDQITAKLATTLGGSRGTIKAARYVSAWEKSEASLEEYDYYLRGHDVFYRFTPEAMEDSRVIWQAGLEKYPDSGLLKVKIGITYGVEARFGWVSDTAANFELSERFLIEGLADPKLPSQGLRFGLWVRSLNAVHYYRNCDSGLNFVNQLIETYPYDAESLFFVGSVKAWCGQVEDAGFYIDRAMDRTPRLHPGDQDMAGSVRYRQGLFEDAVAHLADAPQSPVVLATLIASHVALGEVEQAEGLAARLRERFPTLTPDGLRGLIPDKEASVAIGILDRLKRAGWPDSR